MRRLLGNAIAVVFAPLLGVLFVLWLFARQAPRAPRVTHRKES